MPSSHELILASDRPVLVEVGAEWCPPCRAMAPVLDAVAAACGDRLRIVTVDADAEPGIVARYDVRALPTLLVLRGGRLVSKLIGARGASRLLAELSDALPELAG